MHLEIQSPTRRWRSPSLRGSVSIAAATVLTDGLGNASWPAGYFHTAGQQTIEASVPGFLLVSTFAATVTATNHPFDGTYKLRQNNFIIGGPFKLVLESGMVTFPPQQDQINFSRLRCVGNTQRVERVVVGSEATVEWGGMVDSYWPVSPRFA